MRRRKRTAYIDHVVSVLADEFEWDETTRDICLGVTEQALRKWRERGLIPFIKVGRRVFFDRHELDAHMADNRVEAWAA